MGLMEELQNYFLVDLPNKIDESIALMGDLIGGFAWVIFLIVFIILLFVISKITKEQLKFRNYKDKENEFLLELSSLTSPSDIEKRIFQFAKILMFRHSALYELRGETYVVISSNVPINEEKQRVAISMRISKSELKKLTNSGNFKIHKVLSPDEEYLMLMYSFKSIDMKDYDGLFKLSLSYYESLDKELKITSDKKLAKVSEETMHAIVKAQFGKSGYLKFLISIILKIFNAKGGEILSHDNKESYVVGNVEKELQKEFFIRNTPYKFRYYNDNKITNNDIKEIGAFLDISGSFLISLDHQSSLVQNYISFLKSANKIMEATTPFYEKHSEQVKIVALEVAKNLFVDQETLDGIELAAELHDIGMVGNMEVIMNNKEELNEGDIDLMHYHPVIGSILLEPIAHLYPITNIVKQHHERYDGRGYPNKLKESEISLDAQALALAEHFVGLLSDRSYKKGMEFEKAVEEIKNVSGKMFDPVVVNSFIESKLTIHKKFNKLNSSD